MLSQRQIKILLEYCNHPEEYFTASYFAEQMGVSLRTVQGEIKAIREELENETCMELVAKTSKGTAIVIKNQDEFSAYVNTLYQEMTTTSLNYPTSRVKKILLNLLNAHRAISFAELEDKYYISRTTLLSDLKKVEETLANYQLELLKNSNRIMVDGPELYKRRCLAEQDLYLAHVKGDQGMMYIDERQIARIKNTITEVFVDYKYYITDKDLNNLVLYINIMICRMMDGFYIESEEVKMVSTEGEVYDVAKDAMEKLGHRFFVRITESEIKYLKIYLRGIGSNEEGTITKEMDCFILDSLYGIKERFGYDFTDNLNLRITLALHTISLVVRVQYDIQMKNDMLDYIRETFPLGNEIGAFFAYQLTKKYGKKVSEDEVALLAIHFYGSIMEEKLNKEKAKVLVFTSMKNSRSALLKQTLLRWFSEYVSKIDFADEKTYDIDLLDDYEIILTTEKGEMYENNLAMYINPFPEKKDYFNIKLNIDGFKNIGDVVEIFKPELFQSVNRIKKEEALDLMCEISSNYYDLDGLKEQVYQREKFGSTFLTKQIAIPHPAVPVSSDTFIAAIISKRPIEWDDDGNTVNLILLMHIGKSNPQAFNLWEYIAKICRDRTLVEQLTTNPDYENFIGLITNALKSNINENE